MDYYDIFPSMWNRPENQIQNGTLDEINGFSGIMSNCRDSLGIFKIMTLSLWMFPSLRGENVWCWESNEKNWKASVWVIVHEEKLIVALGKTLGNVIVKKEPGIPGYIWSDTFSCKVQHQDGIDSLKIKRKCLKRKYSLSIWRALQRSSAN